MINKEYSYRELRKDLKRIGVRISHRKYLSHMTFIDCDHIVIKYVIDAIRKSNDVNFINDCICSLGVKSFNEAVPFLKEYYDETFGNDNHSSTILYICQALVRIDDKSIIEWCYSKLNVEIPIYEDVALLEYVVKNEKNEDRLTSFLIEMSIKIVSLSKNYYGNPLEECKYYFSEYALENLAKIDFPRKDTFAKKFEKKLNDFVRFEKSEWEKKLTISTLKRYRNILKKILC